LDETWLKLKLNGFASTWKKPDTASGKFAGGHEASYSAQWWLAIDSRDVKWRNDGLYRSR